jgi:hypothetical protein
MRCSIWISPIVLTTLALQPMSAQSARSDSRRAGDWTTDGPTPFRLTAEGGIVVPVRIDDAGVFPFLLDTGSSQSAIAESLAHHVDAPRAGSAEVIGVVGRETRPVARLARVGVGPIGASNVFATILGDNRFRSDAYVGIIGQDVLSTLHYTVDYRTREIVWVKDRAHCGPDAIVLPLVPADGRFLVELPQAEFTLRLVPDTGAQMLVFYERGTNTLPRLFPTLGQVRLHAAAGERVVQATVVGELLIGPERLRLLPAVSVDRRGPGDARGDGVLPLHMFSRVTFNAPGGTLTIEVR